METAIVTITIGIVLIIILAREVYKAIPLAQKLFFMLVLFMFLVAGISVGRVWGVYAGQHQLLTKRRSLYLPEIVVSRDKVDGRLIINEDTIYHAKLDYYPIVAPAAAPIFFVHKSDTLWRSATYFYGPKQSN